MGAADYTIIMYRRLLRLEHLNGDGRAGTSNGNDADAPPLIARTTDGRIHPISNRGSLPSRGAL
jgi:hypothetical protein